MSLYFNFGAAIGSENVNRGKERLMKPFFSKQIKPETSAVVVAIAGMILPAMNLFKSRDPFKPKF
ncbi:hypothetical protein O9G_003553 [Rozella allomycis CSF55]|uniref:Uncharacterized protein n=1 Tax=Rozella allomycis (strain CSF55) TaxID=988480 RepID=A0A075B058_ROZAC|nr:hypothetical protein O9G_003553 [Rozella allomycis CSF55]|eukprot:EPZ35908.1 hypothetical protein O9G_003553 [Rozella allomycis CSF55]